VLAVLTAARAAAQPLSQLVATLDLAAAVATRLEHVPAETSAALLQRLQADEQMRSAFLDGLGGLEASDTIDGFRMQLAGGRSLHLRPSGNAPELRLYVEAPTQALADALLAAAQSKLHFMLS
jgi:phosphomannomutase